MINYFYKYQYYQNKKRTLIRIYYFHIARALLYLYFDIKFSFARSCNTECIPKKVLLFSVDSRSYETLNALASTYSIDLPSTHLSLRKNSNLRIPFSAIYLYSMIQGLITLFFRKSPYARTFLTEFYIEKNYYNALKKRLNKIIQFHIVCIANPLSPWDLAMARFFKFCDRKVVVYSHGTITSHYNYAPDYYGVIYASDLKALKDKPRLKKTIIFYDDKLHGYLQKSCTKKQLQKRQNIITTIGILPPYGSGVLLNIKLLFAVQKLRKQKFNIYIRNHPSDFPVIYVLFIFLRFFKLISYSNPLKHSFSEYAATLEYCILFDSNTTCVNSLRLIGIPALFFDGKDLVPLIAPKSSSYSSIFLYRLFLGKSSSAISSCFKKVKSTNLCSAIINVDASKYDPRLSLLDIV